MRKQLSKFLVLSVLLCASATILRAAESDDSTSLREEIAFLTDSLSNGRGFGTAGNQRVAFYLLRQMRNAGLNTTVQSFLSGGKVGHNVVGITPGWYTKYIVVGAYFDGLGFLDGEMYPGADSNASGVAALLSLARSLQKLATGNVGIIFVAFDGHNMAHSGAQAFFQRNRGIYDFRLMVNLDILGSTEVPVHKGRDAYLIALGGSYYRFGLENANRTESLDLSYDYYGSSAFTDLFYRKVSDQKPFLDAGIPCVMFTSGITMNTNKMTDTIETIDFPVLERRVSLIGKWLRTQL